MTLTEAKRRLQEIIYLARKPENNIFTLICEADSVLEFYGQHEYDKGNNQAREISRNEKI